MIHALCRYIDQIEDGLYLITLECSDNRILRYECTKEKLNLINVLDTVEVEIDEYNKRIITIQISENNRNFKHTELHISTNLSSRDSVIDTTELIHFAKKNGLKKLAVCDRNSIHSYMQILPQAKTEGIELIYGLECTLVNDMRNVFGKYTPHAYELHGAEFFVIDIETDGVNTYTSPILEVSVYRVEKDCITSSYTNLCSVNGKLSKFITKLTGITDEMLKFAKNEETVLREMYDFMFSHNHTSKIFVSHSNFDYFFLKQRFRRYGLEMHIDFLDTLILSRVLYPHLPKYNLEFLSKSFNIALPLHHRANDDAFATTKLLMQMLNFTRENNMDITTLISTTKELVSKCLILAKNTNGIKRINELMTFAYTRDFLKIPRFSKRELSKSRDDILIIDCFEEGELSSLFFRGVDENIIAKESKFYDGIEVLISSQAVKLLNLSNTKFDDFVEDNEIVKDLLNIFKEEDIKQYYKCLEKICSDKLIATSNAKYLFQQDSIARSVLRYVGEFRDFLSNTEFLKSDEEILAGLQYFENPNKILFDNIEQLVNQIETNLKPINILEPKLLSIENVDELLDKAIEKGLKWRYGNIQNEFIMSRIREENALLAKHKFKSIYLFVHDIVCYASSKGELVGSRGSVGSSIIAYILGITSVNPLPPHYFCKDCNVLIDKSSDSFLDGFDLPALNCEICGKKLKQDGHNLDISIFLGMGKLKMPDIDLNVSPEFQSHLHEYTKKYADKLGYDVYRSGTVLRIKEKNAKLYVEKANETLTKLLGITLDALNIERKILGCKIATSQHPGGLLFVSKNENILSYSPLQLPPKTEGLKEDETNAQIEEEKLLVTHLEHNVLTEYLFKLDILGHKDPYTISRLCKLTNTNLETIDYSNKSILQIFCEGKTSGISEFCTPFCIKILKFLKPRKFSDLVKISGLTHGINLWFQNAEELIKQGKTLEDVITSRDELLHHFLKHNIEYESAYKIMEFIRKGKVKYDHTKWLEYLKVLKANGIEDWYINSCAKITYIFPGAHAVAYVMSSYAQAFFKQTAKVDFFATCLNKSLDAFDPNFLRMSSRDLEQQKRGTTFKINKDREKVNTINILLEIKEDNIQITRPNLLYSNPNEFAAKGKIIISPFTVIKGLGEKLAEQIGLFQTFVQKAQSESINLNSICNEIQFRKITGITENTIKLLRENMEMPFGRVVVTKLTLF